MALLLAWALEALDEPLLAALEALEALEALDATPALLADSALLLAAAWVCAASPPDAEPPPQAARQLSRIDRSTGLQVEADMIHPPNYFVLH